MGCNHLHFRDEEAKVQRGFGEPTFWPRITESVSPTAASEVTPGHSPLLMAMTVVGTQDHGRAEHGQQLLQNLLAVKLVHYFGVAVLLLWLQMLGGVGMGPWDQAHRGPSTHLRETPTQFLF